MRLKTSGRPTSRRAGFSSKLFLSVLIVAVIAMQASTFRFGTRVWPFMAYCMYAASIPPGPIETVTHTVVGVTAGGNEITIEPKDAGLAYWAFRDQFLKPMNRGEGDAAGELATIMNRRRHDPVVSILFKKTTHTLRPDRVESRTDTTEFDVRK
jgi:hypothetical protein